MGDVIDFRTRERTTLPDEFACCDTSENCEHHQQTAAELGRLRLVRDAATSLELIQQRAYWQGYAAGVRDAPTLAEEFGEPGEIEAALARLRDR